MHWKEIYSNPENLVEIKLANPTAVIRYVWIEPAAFMVELAPNTEYKLVTHDRSFRIEFDSDQQFTLWLDKTFGFLLYKLIVDHGTYKWEVEIDLSENQFPPDMFSGVSGTTGGD